MKYKYHTGQYADLIELLDLEYSVYTYDGMSEAEFKKFIAKQEIVVCKLKGHIVGYITFTTKGGTTTIISVVVCPEHRRQGIGKNLVEFAKEGSTQRIAVLVPDILLSAQLFFQACNFRCDKILADYYEEGINAYRFVREY